MLICGKLKEKNFPLPLSGGRNFDTISFFKFTNKMFMSKKINRKKTNLSNLKLNVKKNKLQAKLGIISN